MSFIAPSPQTQAYLVSAFNTIAQHCGSDLIVLDKLSALEGAVLSYTERALVKSAAVACPAATTLAAFISGALQTAVGAAPAAGQLFTLTSAQDTSDTKFDSAKGSVPAVGDVFIYAGSGNIAYFGTTVAALDAALQPYTYRGAVLHRE